MAWPHGTEPQRWEGWAEMGLNDLKRAPNIITASRIVFVGALWWIAIAGDKPGIKPVFAVIFAVCVFTDTLDGFLARKYGHESSLGALLDNIADTLVFLSLPGWIWLLLPELVQDKINMVAIGILVGTLVLDLSLQFMIHRRRVPLHLLSGKTASWVVYLFIIHAMFFDVNEIFKWATFAILWFGGLEEILLVVTRRDLDETVISAFTKRRRPGPDETETS